MKLPKNLNPLYKPYGQYQTDTIGFGVIKDNPGLLLCLGSGKTYCSINICRWRIQNNNVKKILVICPTTIMLKWQGEIHKFSEHRATVLHDEIRDNRIEKIHLFNHDNTHFGIINYEALYPFYQELSELTLDIIVADESARYIKNAGSKRTKASIWLGDKVRYRSILTGTPIANKPLDIWSQYRFLDKGKTFGLNFWAWRNHFFNKISYGQYNKWEVKKDRIQELNRKIYINAIRFKTEDVLKDLPERSNVLIDLEMNKYLLKVYNKIKSKIIAEIETEMGQATLNIPHIFTKLIRLQQVTSGYIKDVDDNIKNLKELPKLNAVVEEVETIVEHKESVIVWCRFRYTIKLLSEMLGKIKHVVMTGDDSHTEKGKKWKEFQESKTLNVFIGQVEAGGIGIELFKINSGAEFQHMIFAENTFVLDHREQAIGRSYGRIGQKSKTRVVDFIFKDTIDEKIYDTVLNNKRIAEEILNNGITKFLE